MLGSMILALLVVLLFWKRWRINNKKLLEFSDKTPGPPTIPILGNALQLMVPSEELSNLIGDMIQQYGDIFRVWIGPELNIFVSEPEDVKTLLTSSKTSIKGPQYKYIADYCGFGILSGSGTTWRTSRKIVLPNYGKKALENYGDVVNREANETVKRLRARAEGETFDVYDDVVLGTTYIVCQTLMGLTRAQTLNLPDLNQFIHECHRLYLVVFMRMTKWYLQVDPFYWMTKYYQQQIKIIKKIKNVGDTIVRHRLKVLDAMDEERKMRILHAEGDNKLNTELCVVDRLVLSNQISSYDEILRQIFTVFTSSQEATAKISSFLLLMVAHHPDCQNKVYAEIKDVFGDSDRDVTDQDLKRMPYLDMVFKEVVRLFPIGVMLQRTIQEDITISKGTLPAGSSLVVPLFHMHRDKRYWKNPDAFDPERFSPDICRLRPDDCYFPFSQGPMNCIGRVFGYKIVKTLCVKVLREFRLSSPETYADLRLVMAVSVASVNGYPVQLHRRV